MTTKYWHRTRRTENSKITTKVSVTIPTLKLNKTWNTSDIEEFCNRHDLYKGTYSEDIEELLKFVEKNDASDDNFYMVAWDMAAHSDTLKVDEILTLLVKEGTVDVAFEIEEQYKIAVDMLLLLGYRQHGQKGQYNEGYEESS